MRTRAQINRDDSPPGELILEVLLDIRDQNEKQNVLSAFRTFCAELADADIPEASTPLTSGAEEGE